MARATPRSATATSSCRRRGNADGWGGRQWLYFPEERYTEAVGVVRSAIDAMGCTDVVVHGFSNGAAFAASLYCHGESFDGRLRGVIVDDPVTDHGVDTCTPAAGVQLALYWTGGLAEQSTPGAACKPMDWTCQGDSLIGIDAYAAALGTHGAAEPEHASHTPIDEPPEIAAWLGLTTAGLIAPAPGYGRSAWTSAISGRRPRSPRPRPDSGLGCAKALAAEGVLVADLRAHAGARRRRRGGDRRRRRRDRRRRVHARRRARLRRAGDRRARRRRHPRGQRRRAAGGHVRVDAIELYQPALEQNLLSIVAMTQAAVPAMQAQHWGRIVAITSMCVRQPIADADPVEHGARRGDGVPQDAWPPRSPATGSPSTPCSPACTAPTGSPHLYGGDSARAADGIPAGFIGEADDFGADRGVPVQRAGQVHHRRRLHIDGGAFGGLQ